MADNGQQMQVRTRGMGRVMCDSADKSRWLVKVHVLVQSGGQEECLGEVTYQTYNLGPEALKILHKHAMDLIPQLIAMQTARIQPVNVVPIMPGKLS